VAIMDHGKVIALGSPRELIASLGAEHVMEFTLADGASVAELESALRDLPGVRAVRVTDGTIALTATALHVTLPALTALLERRGHALASLTTHHASLEDVFVSLTGRRIRDE
jgi:ABC-2 type transport system ATP-binding protein